MIYKRLHIRLCHRNRSQLLRLSLFTQFLQIVQGCQPHIKFMRIQGRKYKFLIEALNFEHEPLIFILLMQSLNLRIDDRHQSRRLLHRIIEHEQPHICKHTILLSPFRTEHSNLSFQQNPMLNFVKRKILPFHSRWNWNSWASSSFSCFHYWPRLSCQAQKYTVSSIIASDHWCLGLLGPNRVWIAWHSRS